MNILFHVETKSIRFTPRCLLWSRLIIPIVLLAPTFFFATPQVLASTYFIAPQLTGSTVANSTVADFTIASTTNSATLVPSIYNDTVTSDTAYVASSTGSYLYTCSYVPSIPVTYSAMTPSIGSIDKNGVTSFITQGNAIFNFISSNRTRSQTCYMHASTDIFTNIFQHFVSGSLARAMYDSAYGLINGKSPSSNVQKLFSAENLATTSLSFTRNPSLLGGADVTATPGCVQAADYQGHPGGQCVTTCIGTLIAPDIMIAAHHCYALPGSIMYFVTSTSSIISSVVSSTTYLGPTNDLSNPLWIDIILLKLATPIGIGVTPMSMLSPGTFGSTTVTNDGFTIKSNGKISAFAESLDELPIMYIRQAQSLSFESISTVLDQQPLDMVGNPIPGVQIRHLIGLTQASTDSSFDPWYDPVISGDSGTPVFTIINSTPVLLSAFFFSSDGPNYSEYIPQINAAMAQLGSPYTVNVVDTSGYPTYAGTADPSVFTPALLGPTFYNVTATSVTLNSAIINNGNPSYTEGFNYGTSGTYGLVASSTGDFYVNSFSQSLTGLSCGTTYHVQAFATNLAGTGTSSDATFTTSTCGTTSHTYTFTGPTSGNVGSPSTNFTVTPSSLYSGAITIVPSGSGSSGLSPVILSFSNSNTAQTFTITPTTAGSIVLTPTNNNGLTDPSNISYTANAVSSGGSSSSSSGGGGGGGGSTPAILPAVNIPAATATTTSMVPNCPAGYTCKQSLTPVVVPTNLSANNINTVNSPLITSSLSVGSSDPQVFALQNILYSLGYLKVAPTGYFGSLTKTAVEAFQKANGISPVGTVGPITRAALAQYASVSNNTVTVNQATKTALKTSLPIQTSITATPASGFTRSLSTGMSGSDVLLLQKNLNSLGYTVATTGVGSPGNESTYFGNATLSALEKYQCNKGIACSGDSGFGVMGPRTIASFSGNASSYSGSVNSVR